MARKIEYTKEEILEVAIKLYKEKNFKAITAKNIAKELKCSVAPIYTLYLSMDDLKRDVILYIGNLLLTEEDKTEDREKKIILSKMFEKAGIDEKDIEISSKIKEIKRKILDPDIKLGKLELIKIMGELATFFIKNKKVQIKKSEVLNIIARHKEYILLLMNKNRI
ncbi:MAG: TetR/AcrR family transcriptional regulator [Fusobacterium sp.]|nr:TetR/AcrR family transcriptional regulator [Fusobacterium sp.]